ncbi:Biosynthetic arginine decarboxylase [Monoraphidium neglectum]|uniref:Arginine decarboxylase n=1 Tax=Monoraphidium neglectum TaxID=145388 RepID=A0A0D2LNG6_9CHLO|nr:Biosynthetic arginine decarboxylase [Monoraphidium neglectum]KIY93344.1 Biosynthetic arginine decarboxylase [Monoraphidium neglectum]|eukprot:XP_013892364.1 Biosynthetic arginine decarboxylase [Monoraphidium neglectum]
MGAGMKFIDVGGGLAVDYDGSFTDTPASMSYTIQNYANDEVCIERGIEPPTIISESGRALASAHTVLVFDVLSKPHSFRENEKREEEEELMRVASGSLDDQPLTKQLKQATRLGKGQFLLTTFKEVYDNIQPDDSSLREAFTDATYFKDEALRAFKLGILSLLDRAQASTGPPPLPGPPHPAPAAAQSLDGRALGDREASDPLTPPLPLFRSTVDVWGISQVFPIMPIHR